MKMIEKHICIHASAKSVWRVFTDATVTRQIGGEYVSDWKVGSSFGWKGKDGSMHTRGVILDIEPGKLVKHNLFDMKDETRLLSVITYEFKEEGNTTVLFAKEELNYNITKEQLEDAEAGWDAALSVVKELAEKL